MVCTRSGLFAVLAAGALVTNAAGGATATPGGAATTPSGRTLEFGPYVGAYDFDPSTWFEDRALVGLRASVRMTPHIQLDAEFDEVYTRRERSGNSARQVSLALHGRVEPASTARISPSLLLGIAFVALDDSEAPDAFSEAYDLGGGARVQLTSRWTLRAEWMVRAQRFQVLQTPRATTGETAAPSEDDAAGVEASTLWGRALRIGAAYAF